MDKLMQFAPLVIIIALMWFILIRPQRKREKDINAMRSGLQVGDNIVTIGGLKGKITKIKDDTITLAVGADRVKMDFARWAISKVEDSSSSSKTSRTTPVEDDVEEVETKKKPRKLGAVAPVAKEEFDEEDIDDVTAEALEDYEEENVEDFDSEECLDEYASEEEASNA